MRTFNSASFISYFRSSRHQNNKENNNNVIDFDNIKEALTIFSEVEEHLACSCQDPETKKSDSKNGHNFVGDSETQQYGEEEKDKAQDSATIGSGKGSKMPLKSRNRRSVLLTQKEPFDKRSDNNKKRKKKHKMLYDFDLPLFSASNDEDNMLSDQSVESPSDNWFYDYSNSNYDKPRKIYIESKSTIEEYLPKGESSNSRKRDSSKTNKEKSTSSINRNSATKLYFGDDNSTLDEDAVRLYYETCLSCKGQQDICEATPIFLTKLAIFRESYFHLP